MTINIASAPSSSMGNATPKGIQVQAAIQQDMIRVSGKDRDTLQDVIALLKEQDYGIDMQFTNYRSI